MYKPNPIWKVRRRCFGAVAFFFFFFFHGINLCLDMSAALLIHRPPTPPQPADKSLSNKLHSSTAPLQPPNKKAPFFCTHKESQTTARAGTITTRSKIKHKRCSSNIYRPCDWFWPISWGPGDRKAFTFNDLARWLWVNGSFCLVMPRSE